jgi:ribosomal protein L11 methyltransferase
MSIPASEWYEEIAVSVPSITVDAVGNYIIENIATGILFEEEDGDDEVVVKFFLSDSNMIDTALSNLTTYLTDIGVSRQPSDYRRRKIKNVDWIDAYKKSVTPLFIGEKIVVKPTWETASYADKIEITLEPRMSFGTGRHETTQSCLLEMEQLNLTGKKVLDLGCGSGILSIYAAKRGAARVVAYDIDVMAVKNSEENFALNKVDNICVAQTGTVERLAPADRFDLIAINIIKSEIVPILPQVKNHLESPGTLLLSGLLDQDAEEVHAALAAEQMDTYSVRQEGEWRTYVVTCP